ncbi:MAG TPA: 2-C-methyl-D-erythritol 4-phosphate cytidylyltransferase [Galbitalea sp.]|jgi:2-C-methyl-D-erythritol 4-phosphate cytidylyltransferase/2-C-methyl-D-erythritol 2,4-cyclodiphosphate synthase|nr:2-C-methyl-D-erythritol 4-phosphate cytidylyltransferase [Galbitalea sp.]
MASASVGVIVVAAGAGTRLGADLPKAFVVLGGRSILERSLESILEMSEPAQIVVVAPEGDIVRAQDIVRRAAGPANEYVSVVPGGTTRQQSVAAGLSALWPDVGVVLVHDAARPFTPTAQFEAVVELVRATGDGVIPGVPVSDTLKRTADGVASETLDRSVLTAVQTPQGFPRAELTAAYAGATEDHTDDAALFAAAGHAVHVLAGDPLAFKITTTWDLRRAESLVASPGSTATVRTGIGIDVHAYDDSVPLWLGAVHWADEPGLAGHSDGDALSHAICDALLSAAGLGDLGTRFGTEDPRFADAHGEVFLSETAALVRGSGFGILNVAVQVIGNRPRLATRRAEVEKRLSELVGAPVSVAATTSDGLGFTGSGEGLAAVATALLTT